MKLTDDELTVLAAEKVMGFVLCRRHEGGRGDYPDFWGIPDPDGSGSLTDRRVGWSPLTDWSAAGEITDKMRELGWYQQTDITPKGRARATFHLSPAVHTSRDDSGSMPRAITLAALLAVGAVWGEQL